jgi:hypothetical protein
MGDVTNIGKEWLRDADYLKEGFGDDFGEFDKGI